LSLPADIETNRLEMSKEMMNFMLFVMNGMVSQGIDQDKKIVERGKEFSDPKGIKASGNLSRSDGPN
jgi:hypothetical protein